MSKQTLFSEALEKLQNRKQSMVALKMLLSQAEMDEKDAKTALGGTIRETIREKCSVDFVSTLKQDITSEVRSACGFGGYPNNYEEFLTEVIFMAVTEDYRVIGFEQFIMPGKNYQQGADFFEKYRNDFIVMSRIFQFSMGPVPEITIGYARRIEKA